MKPLLIPIWACIFIIFGSCSLSVDPKTYKSNNYKVVNLPDGWSSTDPDLSDFAYQHGSGAFLVFNSVCKKYSMPELAALKNSLLYGVSDLKVTKEKKVKVFNREALEVNSVGKIDGVGVHIFSKIFNRNHCTHDVVLISPQTRTLGSLKKEIGDLEKIMVFE